MTAERWARITSVFSAVLEKPPDERSAFLDLACGDDRPLRRDVERLLAGEGEPSLLSPIPELLTRGIEIGSGEMLAQYRVEAKIGEGGMGAVYRAFDTRLQRQVALKLLPTERLADQDGRHRLMREARAASGLNHPNIVTIYEIGSAGELDFIAMEYVEGKNLAALIPPTGLPPAKLLGYAVQIADALARAHGARIIHRDLKPSNIMVTSEGRVTLLDFGLAKVFKSDHAGHARSVATQDLTEEGTVLGTAPYMSPEQAQGLALDARSDIFSFGSVLYEMATGQRPFTADSTLALLTKIVSVDPKPLGQLAPVPAELEQLILRCLRKDASRRYQTMADLKVALEDLRTETLVPAPRASMNPSHKLPPLRSRMTVRNLALAAAAIVAAVTMVSYAARLFQRSAGSGALRTVKFTITPAALLRGGDREIDAEVSISRDGKHIAYVESQGGQLWVRDIDQERARPVSGATAVYQAFWSPDNRSIGYSSGRYCGIRGGCDLAKIPVEGGTPITLTKLQGPFRRASWSSDGETIVFCDTTGMYTVSTKGGTATRIVEHPHIEHPSILDTPNGRRAFLYQTAEPGQPPPTHGIYVQLAGEQRRLIRMSASSNPYPVYSPTGHIVYVDGVRDSTAIWAMPFSLEKLQATGEPFVIAQHGSSPVVSLTGTLVYSDVPSDLQQLAWVDRSGARLGTIGDAQRQGDPLLSGDGHKLAVEVSEGDADIWVFDLERGVKSRLTFDSALERPGAWTPSGDEVTYASNRTGSFHIYSKMLDGKSESRQLVGTAVQDLAPDWSPDGKFLIYAAVSTETRSDLLYRERRGDGSLGDAAIFLKTPFDETAARFSPDGRFVVYQSDESGKNEIYVRDFPNGTHTLQISSNGGTAPRWRRDGKEIVYVEERKLMAVSVMRGSAFSPGAPVRLFDKRSLLAANPQYDVSADGKRFVILDRPIDEQPLSIHVVHNWFEEFRGGHDGQSGQSH